MVTLRSWSLIAGLFGSACIFVVMNIHYWRPASCADCGFPHGLPFTFFREGGFAGGGGIVWIGMAGDVLVLLAFGLAAAWILTELNRKT
jgi:hypothetical protein